MAEIHTPVDIEALVVAFLREDPDLLELHAGEVSTETPAEPVLPRLRITRQGGLLDTDGWVDRPRVVVESWAQDKATAHDLAARALAVLHFRLPAAPFESGVVTDVRVETGLAWTPDDTTSLARYTFAVVLTTHPTQ